MSCATLPIPRPASSYSAMTFGKIFGAAHLLEAADGALEFEGAVAGGIKALGLRVGGGEKLHLVLVEGVDESHEARRFVAHIGSHHRDTDDDHGVETPGDGEIIGSAA